MTSTAAPNPLAPEAPLGALVASSPWRCPIEKQPWLHAFIQTIPGKLALLFIFTGLMVVTRVHHWKETAVALTLLTFLPKYRKPLLVLFAAAWVLVVPPLLREEDTFKSLILIDQRHHMARWFSYWPVAVAAVWAFGFAYVWMVRRFPKSPIGRRPVTGLMVILLLMMAAQQPLTGLGWAAVATFSMVLGHYIWFFGYTVSEPKQQGKYPPVQPGYWRYFWAMNRCPMGKGPSYLDRVEAKDANQLATVQLKGLKLLFWAAVLSAFKVLYTKILYGPHSESQTGIPFWPNPPGLIPTYQMAVNAHVAGTPLVWHLRWLTLISFFLLNILELSIFGHKLIAVARMAGFNAFRMTYRPLTATSISEFFNRIHWYLKEMLATFFFYPTHLRYFKKHPRLRVFAATMASACFGNFIYHFFAYDRHIYERGLWEALKSYHHYAIYTIILGVGIGISQMRIIGKKKVTPTGWRKVIAIAGVLFFYCILTNFDNEVRRDLGFIHYWGYFVSLFRPW